MIGVATLLSVVTISLLINRVAATALRATGLSSDVARFQARSAFSGVGFTTVESEDILTHPARRRIVLTLMALSGAGVVTLLASLLLSFAGTTGVKQPAARAAALAVGLLVLWRLASSKRVDARLSRIIERGLARWTDLDARDYVRLLEISGDYSIDEIEVDEGDWLQGRQIGDLQLHQEGIVVLGIRRRDGRYTGAPTARAVVRDGDTVILYGRASSLDELRDRRAGAAGERAHDDAKAEHRRIVEEQAEADVQEAERQGPAPHGPPTTDKSATRPHRPATQKEVDRTWFSCSSGTGGASPFEARPPCCSGCWP